MQSIEVIGYEEGIICNFLEKMDIDAVVHAGIDAEKNMDMEMKRRRHNNTS
jgi:hypothetical protein